MNTRFHVPSKVFGSRRKRDESPAIEPAAPIDSSPAQVTGTDPVLIDSMLEDRPGRAATYLIPGRKTALIDPGPAVTAPRIIDAFNSMEVKVDLILLTHLHPDAAAGAGVIARHFPDAKIAAPVGSAGRLSDPSALVSDMEKIYGDRAKNLYGLPAPIDGIRVTALEDGSQIDLGDRSLKVIATPGHTAAHISFFDPETSSLFCGDALGVQIPGSRVVRPSTPPWDFSLEDSLASIERLSAIGAETVWLPHFGAARPGPDEIFDRASDSLRRWHQSFLAKQEQTDSEEDLSRQFNACVEASLEPIAPAVRRDLEAISPAWLNLAGLTAEQARLNDRLSGAA